MLDITRSDQRFHLENEWLSAYWHFSFDHYYDPNNMGFGPLRVFNNDTIQPGQGFPMHPHRDMEILTYVIDGELEHKDNTGGHGRIRPGEIQRMSAGTGIVHSEFNASKDEMCELVQIWILPAVKGSTPSHEQKRFTEQDRTGKFLTIASGTNDPTVVKVGQDVALSVARIRPTDDVRYALADGRRAYLFVMDGSPELQGEALSKGDNVKVFEESELHLTARDPAEVLLIDLP